MCFYQIPYEHPHLKGSQSLEMTGFAGSFYVLRVCILPSYITKFA